MAEVTLKNFLENDSAVKAARKKLTAASAELNKQKAALASAGGRISPDQRSVIEKRIATAEAAFTQAQNNAASVEASRTSYFETNKKTITAAATSKEVSKAKQELEEVTTLMQSQPNSAILQARAADLKDRINQTGKYAPKPKVQTKDQTPGDQAETVTARDYVSEVNNAAKIVRSMSASERQNLAEVLKSAKFYDGPITGIYNDALVTAYQSALAANQARSLAWGEEVSWPQFLQDKVAEAAAIGAGTGIGKTTGAQNISTSLEAAAKVEKIFMAELGRLPTPAESAKFSADLIAEEKKPSSIIKTTPKKIGGVVVNTYSGGLDKDQFLTNLVRKLPDYSQRKTDARNLTMQDLAKTAAANGFDLNKDFGSVAGDWAKRVQNGEKIDTFKNIIRQTAKLGLPDKVGALIDQGVDLETIYSPYRRIMAATLEVDPSSIKLDDPVLRAAYGPDKEMSIFDFKRAVRKDPRWQYTDNARQEVSNTALQILRDFGFQG